MVVGVWSASPFGAFADVMVQTPDDDRVLLAPDERIADFVGSTYAFDRVELGPVSAALSAGELTVTAPGLDIAVTIGGPAPIDLLLRLVPGRLAIAPWWLRAIDPISGPHRLGGAHRGQCRQRPAGVLRGAAIAPC